MSKNTASRRKVLKSIAGTAGLTLAAGMNARISASDRLTKELVGNVNHSVCKWCYRDISLEDLSKAAVEIGLDSIELLNVSDFPTIKKYGLSCAMASGPAGNYGITNGWNKKENHEGMIEGFIHQIDEVAKAGFKNVITFSGNRQEGLSDEEGLENCVLGLQKIIPYAENKKVTVVMELLNSKINHPNYMCDRTNWGVELCKKLESDNFKLLYDIYHMQIMEGDVIRTIQDNYKYIAHYHTGGVPGRNEIDDSQELYYPAIIKAILDTGYKGHIGQEFIPKREDKLASLKQGVTICDI